jgi:predicted dehydrogenase|tara:strand:+ start:77 stop:940 length:864 start_codon:yes stop_codon:yes gene_type:complete
MKSLIVGMGIGELYKSVLTQLDAEVITVDINPDKDADFTRVEDALVAHGTFDTVNICTPNFTHAQLTQQVAPYSKIVFVEKPGFKNANEWQQIVDEFPNTRIMMVKNNMWRNNIGEMQTLAARSNSIDIKWIRKDCIPHPGSWFTTKELAYGGVSRDLVPHLLSLYIALNPYWYSTSATKKTSEQQWTLQSIDSTDYGTINQNGTYNVDDKVEMSFGERWRVHANWRSLTTEESCVTINDTTIDLGWCPEEAYYNMIKDAVGNIDNDYFWNQQVKQDIWIHKQIETL